MSQTRRICFVVMPFRAELNFFYLYIQKYLEERHGLSVRRGDTNILTKSLMDKIESEIQAADVIIGDISYSNPNVYYELGIARANRKPIIFLTQEEPELAPVDLRQFEFIRYDLAQDADILTKLDNAIRNVLGTDYTELFEQANVLLKQFNTETGSTYPPAPIQEFQARVIRGEVLSGIPDETDSGYTEFLLPKIVADASDFSVIRKLNSWLSKQV